jgi:hypothetical protein
MTFALSAASISRHGCSPMIVPRAILLTLDRTSASGSEIWAFDDRDLADTLFQIDECSKFQTQKGLIFGLV